MYTNRRFFILLIFSFFSLYSDTISFTFFTFFSYSFTAILVILNLKTCLIINYFLKCWFSFDTFTYPFWQFLSRLSCFILLLLLCYFLCSNFFLSTLFSIIFLLFKLTILYLFSSIFFYFIFLLFLFPFFNWNVILILNYSFILW